MLAYADPLAVPVERLVGFSHGYRVGRRAADDDASGVAHTAVGIVHAAARADPWDERMALAHQRSSEAAARWRERISAAAQEDSLWNREATGVEPEALAWHTAGFATEADWRRGDYRPWGGR